MIESIILKNVATYDTSGISIENLGKVNFIYGSNGSGKTTLSNFLNTPSSANFVSCDLEWKNQTVLKTFVYNRNFREENFGKGKLNGIFTLGKATTDEIKVIEDKKLALKKITEEGNKKKETIEVQASKKNELEETFRERCWLDIYKNYETKFKEAFKGVQNKDKFRDRILEESKSNTVHLCTYNELCDKADTIFGEEPKNIASISLAVNENLSTIETDAIWKKIIVGKSDVDIADLITKLNSNDWVSQGRNYIQEQDSICPFCQQSTITDKFKASLENYFDESYLKDITKLRELRNEYVSLVQSFVETLEDIINSKQGGEKLDLASFEGQVQSFKNLFFLNKELLENKIKEPSRSITLHTLTEVLESINKLIKEANTKIENHNEIVRNFASSKADLIKSIWRYIVEESKTSINKFIKDKTGLEKGIALLNADLTSKREQYTELDREIKSLNKNITSIQPAIDEINTLLRSYGFLNFLISPATEKGFYQIERENGEIAETTLSEGEVTFVTFLYFLQLAKGGVSEEEVSTERILVIDDPISSLDSNILFVVSTLLKEMIKRVKADDGDIRQIIILTHNVYFHKEVSYEGLNRKGEKSMFWILRKSNNISQVYSYGNNNPIQSSYELLWREIKEWENNSGITIQNALRRILENYFNILGSKRDDTLIDCFPNPEEKEICRSLLSWSNEGSHTLPDDLYIESPNDTIESYLKVFKEIFVHTQNIGHYNMMMQIDE